MARASRPWFRFYVEAIYDDKLRDIPPARRWVWAVVMAVARESPEPGWLLTPRRDPMGDRKLAEKAAVPVSTVRAALGDFEAMDMIARDPAVHGGAWHVTNWDRRQFESDDVTKRTAKHRSKERSSGVPGNAPETETETDVTTPPPPAERGATGHAGQHPNCRDCGTNRRGRLTPKPDSPRPVSVEPEDPAERTRRLHVVEPAAPEVGADHPVTAHPLLRRAGGAR